MRLFPLLTTLALLASGCASDPLLPPTATPTVAAPTQTLVPAPTATPIPTPAATPPSTTGIETPCDLGHSRPVLQRQKGFLEWSPDGSSLVFDVDMHPLEAIWEIGVDGSYARKLAAPSPLIENQSQYGFHADPSPDGLRLVYSTCEYEENVEWPSRTPLFLPVYELAVVSVDGGKAQRLTESSGPDQYPAWSPDGSRIAYIGTLESSFYDYGPSSVAVWIMPVNDGTGDTTGPWALDVPEPGAWAPVWSPDGKHLAVVGFGIREPGPVHVVDVGNDAASSTSRVVGVTHIPPAWSPDGTRLVFADNRASGEAATAAVSIVDLEGIGSVDLPEMEGHISQVAWHPDGSEILVAVFARRGGLWSIDADEHTFSEVFRHDDPNTIGIWSDGLAWSPDGSRFAIRIDDRGPYGYVFDALATATRTGDNWRVVAVGGYSVERGFALCDMPVQNPVLPFYSGLLDKDIEKHCEPAGEQSQ